MNNTVVANFIKTKRKEAGLTQEELASKANVHRRTVQNIELGKPASEEMIKTICLVLGYQFVINVQMIKIEKD